MFHLAWFMNGYTPLAWDDPWAGSQARDWMHHEYWVSAVQAMERAGFDYLLIEDTSMVHDAYGRSMDTYLRYAIHAPKNDPLPLVPYLASGTRHMGIVPTISSTLYPPFIAARVIATLDHLTRGRVGVNVVTSVSDRAAQNFGMEELPEHDLRYRMGQEWMDVVDQLWTSWEPDAIVADLPAQVFVDPRKVHEINFEGEFHKVRGPLNTIAGPQRRPVVAQAGGSEAGRDFAARNADTILASRLGIEQMREYRDDIRVRAEKAGRNPDDIKVMFIISPILGRTDAEAQARLEHLRDFWATDTELVKRLAHMSYQGGNIDYSAYDLDGPMPAELGNGEQSVIANYHKISAGRTLRQIATARDTGKDLGLVGSPETVAKNLGDAMEVIGGDGFLFANPITPRSLVEITDWLVPELRRQGLSRTKYECATFRENLMAF